MAYSQHPQILVEIRQTVSQLQSCLDNGGLPPDARLEIEGLLKQLRGAEDEMTRGASRPATGLDPVWLGATRDPTERPTRGYQGYPVFRADQHARRPAQPYAQTQPAQWLIPPHATLEKDRRRRALAMQPTTKNPAGSIVRM
jgi:hypothetical protein